MSKKRKAAARWRSTQQRHLQAQYPYYVPCQPGEAEQELGGQRSAELEQFYEGPLRKADLELEKLLRSGRFTMISSDASESRSWTMAEYVADFNAELAADARRNDEEPEIVDAAEITRLLHRDHLYGELRVTKELALRWV